MSNSQPTSNEKPQPPDPQQTDGSSGNRTGWLIAALLGGGLLVVLILALLGVFTPGDQPTPAETALPTTPTGAFIIISEPLEGQALDTTRPVVIRGQAGQLFEGGLVVEVLDEAGNLLALEPTIVDSPEAGTGGQGPWEVTVDLQGQPEGAAMVVAYATSPKDGSRVAQATANVVLAGTGGVPALVRIEQPASGAELDTSQPVLVSGMGQGLIEGNVVVQALDSQGRVVAEQITTAVGEDVGTGGPGAWEVSLAVPAETSGSGSLRAISPGATGAVVAEDSIPVIYVVEGAPPGDSGVSVEDHLWLLLELDGQPVLAGTRLTAEFTSDRVAGLSGCNSFNAPFEGTLSNFSVGEASTTRRTCEDPEGIMAQENAYLAAMAAASQGEIADGQLALAGPDGQVRLRFAAAVVGEVVSADQTLDPAAVVIAQLRDVSLADTPAQIIAEQRPAHTGEFPISFDVTYDPALIQPERSYSLYVRIESPAGDLLYATTTNYPVITGGAARMLTVEVGAAQ